MLLIIISSFDSPLGLRLTDKETEARYIKWLYEATQLGISSRTDFKYIS